MVSKLALDGVKIIDLTNFVAAPTSTELLSQWGAEVIHVEHLVRGDACRGLQAGGSFLQHPVNYGWELLGINKKSLAVDLSKEEGKEIIYRLIAKSDVFVSSLRHYEIKKFGMEYERLKNINHKLIYANLTGYGQKGPLRDGPGFDLTCFFGRAGISHMIPEPGQPPMWHRPALGDFISGMTLACGIMVALFARERLGIGQEVNTSLFRCGVWALQYDIQGALLTHQDVLQRRRQSTPNPLFNFYKTKNDRWIMLCHPQSDPYWPNLCQAIERKELEVDPRFSSTKSRAENSVALIKIIDEAFSQRTFDEWKDRLPEFGLAWGPVQKPSEVVDDQQARANDFFQTFNHPTHGPIELVAAPIEFGETPGTFRTAAPELGQHTEEILLELDYSWDEIGVLKDKGVII